MFDGVIEGAYGIFVVVLLWMLMVGSKVLMVSSLVPVPWIDRRCLWHLHWFKFHDEIEGAYGVFFDVMFA